MKLKISVVKKSDEKFAEVEIYKDDLALGRDAFIEKCVTPCLEILFDSFEQDKKDGK